MKRHLGSLAAVLILGVSALGLVAYAQQAPPSSRQQPMEIPAQYPQDREYPPGQQYPQDQGDPQNQQDQPDIQDETQYDRGAARLSFIHGDVSTQHGDAGEWVAGTLNTPIVNGDHVSTGKRSRTEIQLDHANVLRMSDESTANIVNLSRTQMQIEIGQGLVSFDVLNGSEADVEIDTPNVAIRPQMNEGSYRIMVNSDDETVIDVRNGSVEISTSQGSTRVDKNQRITIQGNADNAQYSVSRASSKDDWDKWNSDRDHVITSAESWQHTNPYYTGSQDLDTYGRWNDVPEYGSVWFPETASGWAPYRDGRWVYEPFYGWTWVSYEPWGWAPYHYGRWFVYGGRWGWWPGPVHRGYRPIWAPAYVSFFGFGGSGWGVGVGFSSVGWLPIGPGDRFHPWYGRGVTRVNVVNVYNVHNDRGGFGPLRGGRNGYSNINRAFTDDHVRGGISSMRGDQFGRGRVPTQQQRVDAGSFRQASMITGRNPVGPSRESFRPSDRQVSPGAIPNRASGNQRFFSTARRGNTVQPGGGRIGTNRGGNPDANPAQQNSQRPGFRNFGSRDSGNQTQGPSQDRVRNQGNRPGETNSGPNLQQDQRQQNNGRPGFRNFGSRNSGNVTPAPTQDRTANPGPNQSQQNADRPDSNRSRPGFRNFGSRNSGNEGSGPAQITPQSQENNRGNWRTYNPSSGNPSSDQSQPDAGNRNSNGQDGRQSRPNVSQPMDRQSPNQNYSRERPGNSGYSRPPLNMQQPIVTPRSDSTPRTRSAPSEAGNSGRGGYRGGSPDSGPRGGEYRGGSSGGGSRGGNSGGEPRGGNSGGGRSGHGRR